MKTVHATQTCAAEDQQLVDLVEEITSRLQAGQPCNVEDYATRFPQYADRLRQWIGVMVAMADLGHSLQPEVGRSASATAGCSEFASANLSSSAKANAQITGILGDFRILRELGRGGMGVVYEAEQISLGRRVALKVLPFAAMLDKQQLARFKNEARAAATLDHPNIVAIHSVGTERGVHYYAMQLIDGQSLAEAIAQLRNEEREAGGKNPPPLPSGEGRGEGALESAIRIPQSEIPTAVAALSTIPAFSSREYCRTVARVGIQAAEALDHAHQNGILHRDIKPANLLLDDVGKLWITDFGLARIETDLGLTMTGDILGTLRYMSPEQALAKRVVVDHRSDIYSLGVTLYELLTLRPAYAGDDRQELLRQIALEDPLKPRQINARIPRDLETIILKSIEKAPADRYATAQELADDLRRFLDDQPITAKPQSILATARKWSSRHRSLVVSASASFTAIAVISLILLASSNLAITRERNQKEAALQEKTVALEAATNDFKSLLKVIGTMFEAFGKEALTNIPLFEDLRTNLVGRMSERIALNPDDWNAWYRRGLVHYSMHQFEEAVNDLTKAIELNPDELVLWSKRADSYRASDQLPAAVNDYTRLLRLNPNDGDALGGRGQAYCEMSRFSEAVDDLTKSIELDPNHSRVWVYRGTAYFHMKKYEEAVDDYTKAIEGEPTNRFRWDRLVRRAEAYRELKRYREAVDDYNEAIKIKPDDYLLLTYRAQFNKGLKKYREAVDDYNEALKIKPDDYVCLTSLAWLLATAPIDDLRNGPLAVAMSTKACELTEYKLVDLLDTLAAAYAEAADFGAAVKWEEKAFELSTPDDPERPVYEQRLDSYRQGQPWRLK